MSLTGAQVTALFEMDTQMGIPQETIMQIQAEGITMVDYIINF